MLSPRKMEVQVNTLMTWDDPAALEDGVWTLLDEGHGTLR